MFIFDNVSNKQEKNTPKDHACQGICYTFVEKYYFPKEHNIRCVEQKERSRSSLSAFFSCTYLTANSNTPDSDMADSIRGVLRRSRINRVMKIGVNDKKSVGSVKANMVVRINVIVSSFKEKNLLMDGCSPQGIGNAGFAVGSNLMKPTCLQISSTALSLR